MGTETYHQAIESARAVLTQVADEQLGSASPCDDWTVREVINHLIDAQRVFAAWVGGQEAETENDWTAGDFVAAFDRESAEAVAAFEADGVLAKEYDLGFTVLPGTAILGMATADTFVHAWDVAKATGQSTDLNPALSTTLLSQARHLIQNSFRNEHGNPFGLEKSAPADASPADQLAAFLGRIV